MGDARPIVGAGIPTLLAGGDTGPGGGTGTEPPLPGGLVVDLFHGDQLIPSPSQISNNQITLSQNNVSDDNTWRLRIMFLHTSPPDQSYVLNVHLAFPSTLPIFERGISLAFFQQGFDDSWNGRNYVTAQLIPTDNGYNLDLTVDPELASYYNLTELQYSQPISIAGDPFTNLPIMEVSGTHLSINTIDGNYQGLQGPLAFIRLEITFTGVDGQPISGDILGFDVNVHDFVIDIDFFLTEVANTVGYVSRISSDFSRQIYDTSQFVSTDLVLQLDQKFSECQDKLDAKAYMFGRIVTPWLLGAAFDVWRVHYSPAGPVIPGTPQGGLVIDYVGQASGDSGPVIAIPPDVLTITTDIVEGITGQVYTQEFSAVGGSGTLTWTVAGNLPPGLLFAGSTLKGIPTSAGIYHVQVTVRDEANAHASLGYAIAINTPDLSISTSGPLPDATAGDPYGVALSAEISTHPIWSATGLPAGLGISDKGVISGIPVGNASHNTVVVTVQEPGAVAAYRVYPLTVRDALLFPVRFYSPRGDGDSIWKPSKPSPQIPIVPPHVGPSTTPGDLSKIDHIVVVMMENRSFDHMLGYLSREGGRRDVEGLKWEAGNDRTQLNFYKGRCYYPILLTDTHAFYSEVMSPDHSHEAVKAQMADGMMHFVADYAKYAIAHNLGDDPSLLQLVMGYYGAQQLATYDLLAREFAICDHWFCSHVGPTWPNRFVTITGDLNRDSYGEPEVNTPLFSDFTPSEATTIFDLLTARGVSWRYFQQRASIMRAFTKYTFDMVNVVEFDDPVHGFLATVQAGLPSVTFVDPLFGDLPAGVNSPQDNDDAPPSDLKDGQRFIASIVDTLFTINPHWDKTMLIVVYDEHGGFYDHVEPPMNEIPLLGQSGGRLGPRVPALVVSAWTPPGLVLKDTFDHSAIGATILRRFCSPHPPIMSPRVTNALDLRGALPLSAPRGLPLLLGTHESLPMLYRSTERRFTAPRRADSWGSFLGGLSLTLGSIPR
jgi:phospholipase C